MRGMGTLFWSANIFLLFFMSPTFGQTCVFTDTRCTCSFGSSAGGCYEPTGTVDSVQVCAKRTCDAGWICDCEGDYLCDIADVNVYRIIDEKDNLLTSDVPCEVISQTTVISSGLKLGYFYPQFSEKGLLDQKCQTFAWFLDGVLQANFDSVEPVTSNNLADVKSMLSDWNSLPLRSGSVIAFRWKNEDYSCYNSISSLSINGTVTDTSDTTLVSHRFTHNFEANWFTTTFAEGSGWSNPQTSNFGDSFDTENVNPTNTYWRIKIL